MTRDGGRLPRIVRLVGPAVCLAACVPVPHDHTPRPALEFHVRDAVGRPVAGGLVRVYGWQPLTVGTPWVVTLRTDAGGQARLAGRRERHAVYLLFPHGEVPWLWTWCAEAPGLQAGSPEPSGEGAGAVEVTLAPADDRTACQTERDWLTRGGPPNEALQLSGARGQGSAATALLASIPPRPLTARS